MPSELDVIRVALLFSDIDSEAIMNTFTMRLADLATASWGGVADEIEVLFTSMYSDWLDEMPTSTESESFSISLRDPDAGQWNEVYNRIFTTLVGGAASDPYASLNAATVVAYPGLVRHWGFKNLPAPAEGNVSGGRMTAQGLVAMVRFGLDYARNWEGTLTDLNQGVYNEATEMFRPFAANILVKDAMGSRVTRKVGRGI
jgi:hypothetical protein